MVKFEYSRERKKDSKDGRSKRSRGSFEDKPRSRRSFEDGPRDRRGSDRDSNRGGRSRGDFMMTKVTCSSCGVNCEVPFKPTSSKPVYCNDCFAKKDKSGSSKDFNKDFDIINEKLNKIMQALDIK